LCEIADISLLFGEILVRMIAFFHLGGLKPAWPERKGIIGYYWLALVAKGGNDFVKNVQPAWHLTIHLPYLLSPS
jgi:hypothetical protein